MRRRSQTSKVVEAGSLSITSDSGKSQNQESTRGLEIKEKEAAPPDSYASSTSSSSSLASVAGHPGVFKERWDRTSVLLFDRAGNRWKRRLDSMARLIEGPSTCAAIVIEDDSFLIATNSNFPPNSDSEGFNLIDKVMSFFKEFSENRYSDEKKFKDESREIFRIICKASISGLQL